MVTTGSVHASVEGISLSNTPEALISIDVLFDEHRVWSIDLRTCDTQEIPWPESLAPFLRGMSLVTIQDSATQSPIWSSEIRFTDEETRVSVTNDHGVWLALNKWMRLAPSLNHIGAGIQERILDRTEELIEHLRDLNLAPFVVGGTLLGGVRDGALLPHDDDADIAYLSEFTTPAEIAVEGYRVGAALEALGYEVMRHSATHMQLHFRDDIETADYYIDVFAAFFTEDGHINQPFHVRGELGRAHMLPFGTVTISGRDFPAPGNPDAWLTINYDALWRTPIPGYQIVTPEPTRRRFENWFGSFNFGRHFWNGWYGNEERIDPWVTGRQWIVAHASTLTSPHTIELGAGDGKLAVELATPERTVVAADYAPASLNLLALQAERGKIRPIHANLYRLGSLALPQDGKITGSFDLVANHVVEQVTEKAHPVILRLIRMALHSGGSAVMTMHTRPSDDLSVDDPTTWHLTEMQLARKCHRFGLRITTTVLDPDDARRPVGISFHLGTQPDVPHEEISMKHRIARVLRSLDPSTTRRRVRQLESQVTSLREELDEFRSHNAKLAELLDLVERKLTPPSSDASQ